MINIKDIELSYQTTKVLNKLNTIIKEGDFTFILGPNGAGKTSLLKSINSILKIESGDIIIDNQSIKDFKDKEMAKLISFIPQEFFMQFDYRIRDFLLMARYPWLDFWGNYTQKDNELVDKYIDLLDLEKFNNRYFNQLSGGEKQRVLIARALVQDTKYILMDESLSYLDINHQIEILHILKKIKDSENKTIVMVSHNLNLSAEFADNLIFIKSGKVFCEGKPSEIYNEHFINQIFEMNFKFIENPYTKINNIIYYPEKK